MRAKRQISHHLHLLTLSSSLASFDEMKIFELALASHLHDMEGRWERIQISLPNKTIADIKKAYEQLEVGNAN